MTKRLRASKVEVRPENKIETLTSKVFRASMDDVLRQKIEAGTLSPQDFRKMLDHTLKTSDAFYVFHDEGEDSDSGSDSDTPSESDDD